MKIREAGAGDIEAIVSLLADDGLGRGRERPGDPAYLLAFDAMSRQPGNVYLVAEMADQIVGCLQVTIIHGLSRAGATRAQIEGVRVAASARGAGIGDALMQAAVDRARAEGASLVQLTSDKVRTDAHRFYERLGFVASHDGFKLALD
ncbi:MAG: GNAT family N-acetyltransferase [Pseudomonadota bacterium]